jgi:phenylalanine-4-hydroxylase
VLTFKKCVVLHGNDTLFQPSWGAFDLAVGSTVSSVFGGAADRAAYGYTDDFISKKMPPRKFTKEEKRLHVLYALVNKWIDGGKYKEEELLKVRTEVEAQYPTAWLIRFDLYELARRKKIKSGWVSDMREEVMQITQSTPDVQPFVKSSFALVDRV